MVGEQRYGLRLAGEFKREDIVEAVNIAHQHNAKVYVAMNGLFHNDKIAELNEYILFLKRSKRGCDCIWRSCCIDGSA